MGIPKCSVCVITSHGILRKWQLDAMREVRDSQTVMLLNCLNAKRNAKSQTLLHRLLNIISARQATAQSIHIEQLQFAEQSITHFEAIDVVDGQSLPEDIVKRINDEGPDLILNFGISDLFIDDSVPIAPPVLFFRFGGQSPDLGEPLASSDMLAGRRILDVSVYVLNADINGAARVAGGASKIYPDSYGATVVAAQRHVKYLMITAIRNLSRATYLEEGIGHTPHELSPQSAGPGSAARFCLSLFYQKLRRFIYLLFFEQRWSVSTAPVSLVDQPDLMVVLASLEKQTWSEIPMSNKFIYYADPFFDPAGKGILLEGLNKWTGKGEIVRVDGMKHEQLSDPRHHYSYPISVTEAEEEFIVPEIGLWSVPKIFQIENQRLREVGRLNIPNDDWILDPTFVRHDNRLYLFGNKQTHGTHVLFLWSATSLRANFVEHPCCPIRVSPEGARMAGSIIKTADRMFRLGQDLSGDYGDGMFIFEIRKLSADEYEETCLGQLKFSKRHGPHTLDYNEDKVLFDFYDDRFSLLAGYRRIAGRFL